MLCPYPAIARRILHCHCEPSEAISTTSCPTNDGIAASSFRCQKDSSTTLAPWRNACHSEGAQRLKNLYVISDPPNNEMLHFVQHDRLRKRGAGYLLPGELGVSPKFKIPQDWGIKGVDAKAQRTAQARHRPQLKQRGALTSSPSIFN